MTTSDRSDPSDAMRRIVDSVCRSSCCVVTSMEAITTRTNSPPKEDMMPSMDKKYRCAKCSAEFDSQEELDRHVRDQHKQPSTTPPSPERREAPTSNR